MAQPQRSILAPFPPPPDEGILHFALEGLFPPTHVFALNPDLRTLAHLNYEAQMPYPQLMREQQFSVSEVDVLHPLLVHYPAYTPYEVIYASFHRGYPHLNERIIERALAHLYDAQSLPGAWDAQMRPVRNVLSRTRLKLRQLGLDVVSMLEVGFLLIGRGQQIKPTREIEGA